MKSNQQIAFDFLSKLMADNQANIDRLLEENQIFLNQHLIDAVHIYLKKLIGGGSENTSSTIYVFKRIAEETLKIWTDKILRNPNKTNQLTWAKYHFKIGCVHLDLARNYFDGTNLNALTFFENALLVYNLHGLTDMQADIYSKLADCYLAVKNKNSTYFKDRAIGYFQKALDILDPVKDAKEFSILINNQANCFLERSIRPTKTDLLAAKEKYEINLEINKRGSLGWCIAHIRLGSTVFNLHNLTFIGSEENYLERNQNFLLPEQSAMHFKQAIKHLKRRKHPFEWAAARSHFLIKLLRSGQPETHISQKVLVKYFDELTEFFIQENYWHDWAELHKANAVYLLAHKGAGYESYSVAIKILEHVATSIESRLPKSELLIIYRQLADLYEKISHGGRTRSYDLLLEIVGYGLDVDIKLWADTLFHILINYRSHLTENTITSIHYSIRICLKNADQVYDKEVLMILKASLAEIELIIRTDSNEFQTAMDLYIDAVDFSSELPLISKKAIEAHIGLRFFEFKQYEPSMKYLERALKGYPKHENPTAYAKFSLHLVKAYGYQNTLDISERQPLIYSLLDEIGKFLNEEESPIDALEFYHLMAHWNRKDRELVFENMYRSHLVIQKMRQRQLTERTKETFSEWSGQVYQILIAISLEKRRYLDTFIFTEFAKSRYFIDKLFFPVLTFKQIVGQFPDAELPIGSIINFEKTLHLLQNKIKKLTTQTPSIQINDDIKKYRTESTILQTRLNDAYHKLHKDFPITQLGDFTSIISVDELSVLAKKISRPLIQYYNTVHGWFVITIYMDQVFTTILPKKATYVLQKALKRIVDFKTSVGKHERIALRKISRELYDTFFAPVCESIPEIGELIIAPSDELYALPFGLMMGENGKFLTERYNICYVPSFTALKYLMMDSTQINIEKRILNVVYAGDDNSFLPKASYEASSIERIFDDKYSSLQGDEATAFNFIERVNFQASDIYHFTCHSEFLTCDPMMSGLKLSGSTLSVMQIVHNVHLKDKPLVILGGCETGKWEVKEGNELIGLTGAFFFAGARQIISCIWEIDDAASLFFFTKFYTLVKKKFSYSDAFNQSVMALKSEDKYSHPFFWAGFIFHGLPSL